MKILQLCKKFPYPFNDGEAIAVTNLSKTLHRLGCEVVLLSMNTTKHYFDTRNLPADYNHYKAIHTVEIDNRLKVWDAFINLFSKDSYHVSRFISSEFSNLLKEILKDNTFDIIQLETPILSSYLPVIKKYSHAKIVMRAHNVEHEIWQRMAGNSRFWLKKLYLRHLAKKLKRFEVGHLNDFDLLAAITEKDLEFFRDLGFKNEGVVVPIGLDIEDYAATYSSFKNDLSLSFIGSLDWMPNQEGVKWFLDKTWPGVLEEFPELELHVAGKNPPKWMMERNVRKVNFYGEVPCASTFIREHSIMVVPLLSGSGMRVKILEGMALGRVVITTAVGLEGIPASHKKEVLIANTEEEFLEVIRFCKSNPGYLIEMGHQARRFIEEKFDNQQVIRNFVEKIYSLAGRRPVGQSG